MHESSTEYPHPDQHRRSDLREIWIGSERAAKEIGVGRTQVWRLASKKWAPAQEAGDTPPVRVLVMGTEDRPEYKFLLRDVVVFARKRRLKKSQARLKKAQKGLRTLMPLLPIHPDLLVPVIANHRRAKAKRRASGQRIGL